MQSLISMCAGSVTLSRHSGLLGAVRRFRGASARSRTAETASTKLWSRGRLNLEQAGREHIEDRQAVLRHQQPPPADNPQDAGSRDTRLDDFDPQLNLVTGPQRVGPLELLDARRAYGL